MAEDLPINPKTKRRMTPREYREETVREGKHILWELFVLVCFGGLLWVIAHQLDRPQIVRDGDGTCMKVLTKDGERPCDFFTAEELGKMDVVPGGKRAGHAP